MLSGESPFYQNLIEGSVILSIIGGARPTRPADQFSIHRGLTDAVWAIVESCWSEEPTQRPDADQIEKALSLLPDRPEDKRLLSDLDELRNFTSEILHEDTENPFSVLRPSFDDSDEMETLLKYMSK